MKKLSSLAIAVVVLLATAGRVSADVRLTLHDGMVSIVAKDATVRQILEEWARVGQIRVVNIERLGGAPITIELTDVTEKLALDILLRSVSGYLAAPRPTMVSNASVFDRILVNPAAAPPRSSVPVSSAPPPLPQSRFQLQPIQESDDQPNPTLPGEAGQRQPVVNVFTPPQPASPAGASPNTGAPSGPSGSSVPGFIAPAPPQPGQPGQQPPLQPQGQPGQQPPLLPQGLPGRF